MKTTMIKSASVSVLALAAALAVADPVQVTVNGTPVKFTEAQPQMIAGRLMVPLRGVFEAMGANVDWSSDTRSVMADGNGHHVRLKLGSLDASVDGRVVTMDRPAQIIEDTTMVPLRFLSESLGETVDWRPESDLVAITTHDEGAAERIVPQVKPPTPPPTIITPPPTVIIEERRPESPPPPPPPPPPPVVIERDTVLPLRLDQQITSNGSHPGDRVTATVRGDSERYLDLPEGTQVEGRVLEAVSASGSHGGTLEVRFTELRLPNGSRYHINGLVTRLDSSEIVRTDDGRLVAKSGAEKAIDRKGASDEGAMMVLGPGKGKSVGGSTFGGSFGEFLGVFDHRMARNVNVEQGARLALILNRDLKIDRRDLG